MSTLIDGRVVVLTMTVSMATILTATMVVVVAMTMVIGQRREEGKRVLFLFSEPKGVVLESENKFFF